MREKNINSYPNNDIEKELLEKGYKFIAGIDEVGRGCLAGPVVAASVILNLDNIPNGINDSKKLTSLMREKISNIIKSTAMCYSIAEASVEEIDRFNILEATRLAMLRSVKGLSVTPHMLLIDGISTIDIDIPQKCIVDGDRLSVSIAAASVLAKVYRDALMTKMEQFYPGYFFAKNKGYATLLHRKALSQKGMSQIHRKSFSWTPI